LRLSNYKFRPQSITKQSKNYKKPKILQKIEHNWRN